MWIEQKCPNLCPFLIAIALSLATVSVAIFVSSLTPPSSEGQPREIHPQAADQGNVSAAKNSPDTQTNPSIEDDVGPAPAENQSSNKTGCEDCGDGTQAEKDIAEYTYWLAISTGALACLTFLLWTAAICGARKQGRDMRGSLDMARQAMVVSNRGLACGQPWPPTVRYGADGGLDFQIQLAGYGQSPVTVNELYVECRSEAPKGEEAVYDDLTAHCSTSFLVAPGNSWVHPHRFHTDRHRPYIVGYVRFIDIFEEEHISGFCYRLPERHGERMWPAGSPAWHRLTQKKNKQQ